MKISKESFGRWLIDKGARLIMGKSTVCTLVHHHQCVVTHIEVINMTYGQMFASTGTAAEHYLHAYRQARRLQKD